MRNPLRLSLCVVVLTAFACPVHAGWNPDGVTITPSTGSIPKITACTDGAFGTIVAWQEDGMLRAQHVMPGGDLDPAWPALGMVACSVISDRPRMGAVPDRLGGAYVWWSEASAFYLTRIAAGGTVASGWPARGRQVGVIGPYPGASPCVIEDGAHGIYAAWNPPLTDFDSMIFGVHVGPANTSAGGWPAGGRTLGLVHDIPLLELWPRMALAPDGGVFVSWALGSSDTTVVPSRWHVSRRKASGIPATGWSTAGVELGPFAWELLTRFDVQLDDVAADGRGGIFVVIANPVSGDTYYTIVRPLLYRIAGDGTSAPDWPAGGRWYTSPGDIPMSTNAEGRYRVYADGRDGALFGEPAYYTDSPEIYQYRRYTPGGVASGAAGGFLAGHETALKGDGGLFFADFYCCGPNGPFSPSAFLELDQSMAPAGWTSWIEYHSDPVTQWYGDIALAPTGDGGAVFFWSQVKDRVGLFARRFGGNGQTTGVPEAVAAGGFGALRFVAGSGIHARVPASREPLHLDVFDVTGRRLAAYVTPGSGAAREVAIPGTVGMRSGIYWVRMRTNAESRAGKVMVER